MKNLIKNITDNYKLVIGVLILGLFLGWLFFHSSGEVTVAKTEIEGHEGHNHELEDPTTWTCSMHPQIKQDKPGDCPICGMDLIPLASMTAGGDNVDPNEIVMTESAAKLADIQSLVVTTGAPKKSVYLQGKVHADERNIAELTARFGGRIEKLFVNFTGQNVTKGEKLATIYSPELVTAQKELLEAIAFKESRPSLYTAAKGKLKLWDLTDEQILAIEEKGEPQLYFDILSPISGTVTMRYVALGDYIKEGIALFKVVDLTKIWVMFDAYESDLPWIKLGDKIDFTIQSVPGKNYSAKVTYIDPFIDSKTRVAKVRVEVSNPKLTLKPEMFSTGLLESKIAEAGNAILIPKSSILWTGKRAVVYVKVQNRETPSFIFREVVLGPEAGAFYVVAEGLKEGEEIAVNGVFKIDAAAQLQGLPSMMNPEGGAGSTPHDMSKMDIGGDNAMSKESKQSLNHVMVKVGGLCGICKDRIETAALSVQGVESANWESESQMLHLNFDAAKTNSDEIQKAVANVGHDTEKYKAPDAIYKELPECCLYRGE
jgi:Cu(I)/Ag(I) efflux system membrane fusion protein